MYEFSENNGFCLTFLSLQDVNDNPPIFNQSTYTAVLVENTPAGTSVTTVRATDADIGTNAQVAYRLLDEPPSLLDVHNQTGEIFLIASPDFETTISFTARVYTHEPYCAHHLMPKDSTLFMSYGCYVFPPFFCRSWQLIVALHKKWLGLLW